jgi:hypothetical protein
VSPNSKNENISPKFDHFHMMASDTTTLTTSPFQHPMDPVFCNKFHSGVVRPFDYPKSYERLQRFLSQHMSFSSQTKITGYMESIRSKFRTITQHLTDLDLVHIEKLFHCLLLVCSVVRLANIKLSV